MHYTSKRRNRFYFLVGVASARLGVDCWFEDWHVVLRKVEALHFKYKSAYEGNFTGGNVGDGTLSALEEELEMLILQLLPTVSVIFNRDSCRGVVTIRTGLGYDIDI